MRREACVPHRNLAAGATQTALPMFPWALGAGGGQLMGPLCELRPRRWDTPEALANTREQESVRPTCPWARPMWRRKGKGQPSFYLLLCEWEHQGLFLWLTSS